MSGQNPSTFVAMILIIVFANVAGLYGLIISLTLQNQGKPACHVECYNPCCENSKLRTAACAPACIPPLPVSPTYRVFSHSHGLIVGVQNGVRKEHQNRIAGL